MTNPDATCVGWLVSAEVERNKEMLFIRSSRKENHQIRRPHDHCQTVGDRHHLRRRYPTAGDLRQNGLEVLQSVEGKVGIIEYVYCLILYILNGWNSR